MIKLTNGEVFDYTSLSVSKELGLKDAVDNLTSEIFNNLEHGDEVRLNEMYVLYKHTEEDIYTINDLEDWEEILQVMIDKEDQFTFEKNLIQNYE